MLKKPDKNLIQHAIELKHANEALESRKYARDFEAFYRAAWPVMDSSTLVWSWHYSLLCEWITYASSGQLKKDRPEIIGIWFCVPPRTSKSLMVNVAFPCWDWASTPGNKF